MRPGRLVVAGLALHAGWALFDLIAGFVGAALSWFAERVLS